jgi:hypothetical protein
MALKTSARDVDDDGDTVDYHLGDGDNDPTDQDYEW